MNGTEWGYMGQILILAYIVLFVWWGPFNKPTAEGSEKISWLLIPAVGVFLLFSTILYWHNYLKSEKLILSVTPALKSDCGIYHGDGIRGFDIFNDTTQAKGVYENGILLYTLPSGCSKSFRCSPLIPDLNLVVKTPGQDDKQLRYRFRRGENKWIEFRLK